MLGPILRELQNGDANLKKAFKFLQCLIELRDQIALCYYFIFYFQSSPVGVCFTYLSISFYACLLFLLPQMQVQMSELQKKLIKEEEDKSNVSKLNEELRLTSKELDKVELVSYHS